MVQFKVAGLTTFDVELDAETAIRDVKKVASAECGIEPEHMRLVYKDRLLKDGETLGEVNYDFDDEVTPVQVMYTAGHTSLLGGSKPPSKNTGNPFQIPVRGIPGSRGERSSRISGRLGGMAIIRKYGILMKRQEFREKATEIGFRKYR
mmetsp:Transcript_61653/g.147108  ORF Transcript_61653/g.147108 Transcript_61653/m.147108 type:complete len:149 (-) Transcript_61653:114-560(-)